MNVDSLSKDNFPFVITGRDVECRNFAFTFVELAQIWMGSLGLKSFYDELMMQGMEWNGKHHHKDMHFIDVKFLVCSSCLVTL